MIRRAVLSFETDPANVRRRFYRLECGRAVHRNANGSKQWARCGHCEDREDGLASSK